MAPGCLGAFCKRAGPLSSHSHKEAVADYLPRRLGLGRRADGFRGALVWGGALVSRVEEGSRKPYALSDACSALGIPEHRRPVGLHPSLSHMCRPAFDKDVIVKVVVLSSQK